MSKTTLKDAPEKISAVATLPPNARVKALVIGIEDYQSKTDGALTTVDYARRDAEAFLEALRAIYGEDLDSELHVDSSATHSNVRYALHSFIQSLEKDDLFVFYYAGHGFHGQGGNRITTWDTNAHHIEGTTLLLREVLLDPLQESACRRALAFVDACAAEFMPLVRSRAGISNLSTTELKDFLAATEYFAMFLSCSPKEKSYPSNRLKHGIWTYFLLKALRGEAEEALGPGRYLTDHGLKDYLRTAVRQYMTRGTTHKESQTPQALITASGSFAIREVPVPTVSVKEAGDLSDIRIRPTLEFFQGVEEGAIRSLPGFKKGPHFVPDNHNDAADAFIRQLLADKIQEETQDLYEQVKKNFGLRSKEIQHESGDGTGSIETDYFRYSAEPRQSPQDPAKYQIVRRLELRSEADKSRVQLVDETFSGYFDKVVIKTSRAFIDFAALVERLEDIQIAFGGSVRDETAKERVTYTASDGTVIVFSVASGRITISARGAKSVQSLLEVAHGYRFGLDGPSVLLLGA